jgi:hypothetical protein
VVQGDWRIVDVEEEWDVEESDVNASGFEDRCSNFRAKIF